MNKANLSIIAWLMLLTVAVPCAAGVPQVEPAATVHGVRTTLSPDFDLRELPASVLETEKEYLGLAVPIAMAVSGEGTYATYWYCEEKRDCEFDLAESLHDLIAHCEELGLGQTCFIHSIGNRRINPGLTYRDGITYSVAPGEDVSRHGPQAALGKIFHLPGFSGWSYEQPNFWPDPASGRVTTLFHDLNERGWDVDVVHFLHYGRYMFYDRDEMYAEVLTELAEKARTEGYARIVVFGSSRGGSEAMRATVAGAPLDGVVLIEPDWQGPKHNPDGTVRENHSADKVRALGAYLQKLEAPRLGLMFFEKSDWFGDIRAEQMSQALSGFPGALFMLAKPPGLTGHFATETVRFARQYGACLSAFLEAKVASVADCERPELDPQDIANWASQSNIPESLQPISGRELRDALKDGAACRYDFRQRRIRTDRSCTIFGDGDRLLDADPAAHWPTQFESEIELTEDGYCKLDVFGAQTTTRGCLRVYRVGDFFAFVRTDNEAVFIYHYVGDYTPKPAEFVCRTEAGGFSCTAVE